MNLDKVKKYLHKTYFEIRYFSELLMIRSYCSSYKINSYTIYSDLSVDIMARNGFTNTDFKEIPFKINEFYGDIIGSNVKSFENYPKYVFGNINHSGSHNLTSLIGSPLEIHGSFVLNNCEIKSLIDSPTKIIGNFELSNNRLISLDGCPEYVSGDLDLCKNNIESLQDLTTKVLGRLLIDGNYFHSYIRQYKHFYHIIAKEYMDYKIWRKDGSFNEERFKILINDIKNGSLK